MSNFTSLGKYSPYLSRNSQDPLDIQNTTCDQLDAHVKRKYNDSLMQSWTNCMNHDDSDKNPERQDLNSDEKNALAVSDCCNQILLCNNPNDWLKKKNISAICETPPDPIQPHFGDLKYRVSSSIHPMMYGVY
jgi:hypothetical protein